MVTDYIARDVAYDEPRCEPEDNTVKARCGHHADEGSLEHYAGVSLCPSCALKALSLASAMDRSELEAVMDSECEWDIDPDIRQCLLAKLSAAITLARMAGKDKR